MFVVFCYQLYMQWSATIYYEDSIDGYIKLGKVFRHQHQNQLSAYGEHQGTRYWLQLSCVGHYCTPSLPINIFEKLRVTHEAIRNKR